VNKHIAELCNWTSYPAWLLHSKCPKTKEIVSSTVRYLWNIWSVTNVL